MARLFTSGAETGHQQSEGLTVAGTVSMATGTPTPRTGTYCFKSTATNSYFIRAFTGATGRTYYFRGYYQFPTNPTGLHRPMKILQAGGTAILMLELLNTTRQMRVLNSAGTVLGTGTTALTAATWYRVELSVNVAAAGNSSWELKIDGNSEASGSSALGNTAPGLLRFGCADGNLGGLAWVAWDDVALNDDQGSDQASWCGEGSVWFLPPISDPGTGTSNANWTKPGGATTNRHTSVDNKPSVYQADSTAGADAEKFLRNPTNAASNLELNLTDYTTAGVPSGDTITLVQPVAGLGSTSSTDTTGTLELVSNPAVSSKALTTFDNGIASATVTTWPRADGNVVYLPTVTRGTQPVIRLGRAAANRTVMTNMLGLIVESVLSATTWDGVSDVSTSYALSTDGAREAAGVSASTTSYAIATAGERTATGVSQVATSYAIATIGERTTFGVIAATTSFALSTAGARETDGAAAATTSFAISTAGARETFGAVSATTSFAISTAGAREAAGISSVSVAFTLTTAGERTATGIVSATTAYAISTAGERTATGAASVTSAYLISTAGTREAAGVVARPVTFSIVTVPTGEPLGVVARPVTFTIFTEGEIDGQDAEGSVSLGVAFSISTAGQRTANAAAAASTSFSISTAGAREQHGASSATFAFTTSTSGERTTTGAATVHVAFSISTDGIRESTAIEAEASLTFSFTTSTDGQRGAIPMKLRVYRMIYAPYAPLRSAPRGARGPTTPRDEQGAKPV